MRQNKTKLMLTVPDSLSPITGETAVRRVQNTLQELEDKQVRQTLIIQGSMNHLFDV